MPLRRATPRRVCCGCLDGDLTEKASQDEVWCRNRRVPTIGPSKNYRIGLCRLLDGAPSRFLVRATICRDDTRSSSSCLPARPVHLHGRRFRCFEIGHRRTGRVRYLALSARGGRMAGPMDARGCWSGAGFRSHNLPRVLQDRRGLLALARMTERSRPVWG